jgi:hypothetical protein
MTGNYIEFGKVSVIIGIHPFSNIVEKGGRGE